MHLIDGGRLLHWRAGRLRQPAAAVVVASRIASAALQILRPLSDSCWLRTKCATTEEFHFQLSYAIVNRSLTRCTQHLLFQVVKAIGHFMLVVTAAERLLFKVVDSIFILRRDDRFVGGRRHSRTETRALIRLQCACGRRLIHRLERISQGPTLNGSIVEPARGTAGGAVRRPLIKLQLGRIDCLKHLGHDRAICLVEEKAASDQNGQTGPSPKAQTSST